MLKKQIKATGGSLRIVLSELVRNMSHSLRLAFIPLALTHRGAMSSQLPKDSGMIKARKVAGGLESCARHLCSLDRIHALLQNSPKVSQSFLKNPSHINEKRNNVIGLEFVRIIYILEFQRTSSMK